MGTRYHLPNEQNSMQKPLEEQDTLQREQIPPMGPTPPTRPAPPFGRRPGQKRTVLLVLVGIIAIMLVALLTLGTVLSIRQQPPPQQKKPVTQSTPIAPSSTPSPAATATPGLDTANTPQPGVLPGPRPGPADRSSPAYWDGIIGTQRGVNKVESVSFANMLETPSFQALVTVRYTGSDAKLDVYVFTNIANIKPTQIFQLTGLMKGQAKISGYSTVMTAEVDKNSIVNKNKAGNALTVDLFREFTWAQRGASGFIQVAFPGIFPHLTRYQAEMDQLRVNKGQDTWKNDPAKVASALATKFWDWTQQVTTRVLSGGGPRDVDATVEARNILDQAHNVGASVIVTLSRLEGKTQNMWIVIGVRDGNSITLTNISPRSLISNPVKLEGMGDAFENTIGVASVLDHLYNAVGQGLLTGAVHEGMGYLPYSVQLAYDLSFKAGPQEGVVRIQATSPMGTAPFIMVKVLLNPRPQVVQGPIFCPQTALFPGFDPASAGFISAKCANLKGDASLQGLGPASWNAVNTYAVYDQITSPHPVQLFKWQTKMAMISGASTIMTVDIDKNSSVNRGKSEDEMVTDLYREYQWSSVAHTFLQVTFPGIFPDLTRWQAEADQDVVNAGQDTWKLDAVQVTRKMFTTLFPQASKESKITLVNGGSASDLKALVTLALPSSGGSPPRLTKVTLDRLEGRFEGIWEVTGVSTDWMMLTTPASGRTVGSPVTVKGNGPWFEAQIGVVYILDHLYQRIQVGNNYAMALDTNTSPAPFFLHVKYTSSFHGGAQEGFIELVHAGGAEFDFGFVIVKVLLGA